MSDTFKNSYKAIDKNIVSLSVYNVGFQKCEAAFTNGVPVYETTI